MVLFAGEAFDYFAWLTEKVASNQQTAPPVGSASAGECAQCGRAVDHCSFWCSDEHHAAWLRSKYNN